MQHLRPRRAPMSDATGYALGNADIEHDRLIRQATRFRGLTEEFLRAAGICEGLRVLDLGSGIGDVAMLIARIVGVHGEVVGVERDARSTNRARVRAADAGYANVTFREADIANIAHSTAFDAVVGRFILQHVPDPSAILRSALRLLRPKGIVAFQEVSWAPSLAANGHLSLWSACASTAHDAIAAAGADTNVGLALHRIFTDAGIPPPHLKLEMLMNNSPEIVLWAYDLLNSIRAKKGTDLALDSLGDFGTLADRLKAEVTNARTAVTSVAVVSGWSRMYEANRP